MSNFHVHFSVSPWLLLLILPALFFALLPYFRIQKKYRRTRNRVVSIILHVLIMTLCISVLSGMYFTYEIPNRGNEVILLVDVSHSGEETEKERNDFIYSVLKGNADRCKIGVVTFGYGQNYAAPLSYDADKVYDEYLSAERPDDSATDIASALLYARGLFTTPETGKIVLISDGAETDGSALSVIKSIAAEGVRVDTVCYSAPHGEEVRIVGVTLPDYNVVAGDPCELILGLESSYQGEATVNFFEDGELKQSFPYEFSKGSCSVTLTHTFLTPGSHRLQFTIESEGDTLSQNNGYYSYINLQVFERILILERYEGESDVLAGMLDRELDPNNNAFDVTVVNLLSDAQSVPKSEEELRMYDQVILVNVSHDDMPAGFEDSLYNYVELYGGGLLTIGGNERDENGVVTDPETGNPVPHAYNASEMAGTKYQELLPVEVINYTPPLGVVLILDRSGSMAMDTDNGLNRLDVAKSAALQCLNGLNDRDWCGIMTLEDSYKQELALTRMTQRRLIENAINSIDRNATGGTNYKPALERAYMALRQLSSTEKKHIILISDGQPGDTLADFGPIIDNYAEEITLSIVAIGNSVTAGDDLSEAARRGGGEFYHIPDSNITDLFSKLMQELTTPEIKGVVYEPYQPRINDRTSAVSGLKQENLPELKGFYGTKLRENGDVRVPLMGEYVPIYAEWKFGKGNVGCFLCDLELWGSDFVSSPAGVQFFNNVVGSLFPTEDIRPREIRANFIEDNYTTRVSILTELNEGETVEVTITGPPRAGETEPAVQTIYPSEATGYSYFTYEIKDPGVHTVEIVKKAADGSVLESSRFRAYRPFSYSEEYNVFTDPEEGRTLLFELARDGRGNVVLEANEIFGDFVKILQREFDPRLLFIIVSIVLFLLDVAVRKFKFKWIHELIRDRKEKKELLRS